MSFAIRYNLQRHLLTHVPLSERPKEPVGAFECKLCSKTLKFKHRLKQHLSQVHRPKILACHICDMKFSIRSIMLRHLRLHTAHGDTKEDFARRQRKQQECTSGNEDIEGEFSKKTVEDSRSTASGQSDTSVVCAECHKVCCDQRSLWCHYTLKHQKHFKCSVCDAAFGSSKYLKRHMMILHQSNDGNFQPLKCLTCERSFSNVTQFRSHQRIHVLEQYSCKICNRRFNAYYHLQRHMHMTHLMTA